MASYIDVRNALKAAYVSLNLSPELPNIVLRNRPAFVQGDPAQLVVISWAAPKWDPLTMRSKATKAANIRVVYGLDVSVIDQEDLLVSKQPDSLIYWWQSLWQASWGTLNGVTGLYDWNITLPAKFLEKDMADEGFWKTTFRVDYTISQTGDGK